MKRVILIALLYLLAVLTPAPLHAKSTSVPDTLMKIEAQRRDAIAAKDFATLEKIYASDFQAIVASGVRMDRAGLFEIFRQDDPRLRFATDELSSRRISDDVYLITGRLTAFAGDDIAFQQRFIHLYQWRSGRWMIVAAEGTAVRQPSV